MKKIYIINYNQNILKFGKYLKKKSFNLLLYIY